MVRKQLHIIYQLLNLIMRNGNKPVIFHFKVCICDFILVIPGLLFDDGCLNGRL